MTKEERLEDIKEMAEIVCRMSDIEAEQKTAVLKFGETIYAALGAQSAKKE